MTSLPYCFLQHEMTSQMTSATTSLYYTSRLLVRIVSKDQRYYQNWWRTRSAGASAAVALIEDARRPHQPLRGPKSRARTAATSFAYVLVVGWGAKSYEFGIVLTFQSLLRQFSYESAIM
jgi:hypothetical protein